MSYLRLFGGVRMANAVVSVVCGGKTVRLAGIDVLVL